MDAASPFPTHGEEHNAHWLCPCLGRPAFLLLSCEALPDCDREYQRPGAGTRQEERWGQPKRVSLDLGQVLSLHAMDLL